MQFAAVYRIYDMENANSYTICKCAFVYVYTGLMMRIFFALGIRFVTLNVAAGHGFSRREREQSCLEVPIHARNFTYARLNRYMRDFAYGGKVAVLLPNRNRLMDKCYIYGI